MKNVRLIKQNLGIDVSKDDFKVCLFFMDDKGRSYIKGSRTFKNTIKGFDQLDEWCLKKMSNDLAMNICLEATGVYHENLTHYLFDKGFVVSVILPNSTWAYARTLNLKSKTDDIDAKMLGRMGIERTLKQWKPGSPNLLTIKRLCRERIMLLKEKTAMQNRLHAMQYSYNGDKSIIRRVKQLIKTFDNQIKQVEQQIGRTVEKDKVLKEQIGRITQFKGLGLVTVATIIAETNGFEQFTSRSQLVSYAGYDVVQKESGTSIKGKTRISKKGNKHIRRALHFPAILAVRYEPHFTQVFARILAKSHIKMKAYTAIQRKLLVLIYALYKNKSCYDPNYEKAVLAAA